MEQHSSALNTQRTCLETCLGAAEATDDAAFSDPLRTAEAAAFFAGCGSLEASTGRFLLDEQPMA